MEIYWAPYKILIIDFGIKKYANNAKETRINTVKRDFFSTPKEPRFLSWFSDATGNITLLTGNVPKKITLLSIEITA